MDMAVAEQSMEVRIHGKVYPGAVVEIYGQGKV